VTETAGPRVPASDAGSGASGEVARFSRAYPALPESIGQLRAALVDFAKQIGAPQPAVSAVALAVSEAATNVVVHAYRETGEPGVIAVEAAVAGSELQVTVSDAGSGLRPRPDSPGLGLGLGIIAQVADGLDLVPRASGGLELRMRYLVAQADAPAERPPDR
jgi:serine/threonine-protein kinase RsbW